MILQALIGTSRDLIIARYTRFLHFFPFHRCLCFFSSFRAWIEWPVRRHRISSFKKFRTGLTVPSIRPTHAFILFLSIPPDNTGICSELKSEQGQLYNIPRHVYLRCHPQKLHFNLLFNVSRQIFQGILTVPIQRSFFFPRHQFHRFLSQPIVKIGSKRIRTNRFFHLFPSNRSKKEPLVSRIQSLFLSILT